MKSVVRDDDDGRARRAPSRATAAATSSKWCAAMRQATTSKLPSANGRSSARQIDVRLHARRGVAGDDRRQPRLAQPPRDVAAAGRDVERRRAAPGRPLDEQVEVGALAVRRALAVGLARASPQTSVMPPAPPRGARRRASSARRGGSAAPPRRGSAGPPRRSCRRGARRSACSIVIRVERREDPARDLVAARDPAEDVEEDRASPAGRAVITSSASTTPSASPPPPRSQKFAGRPPTSAITSSVDIDEPGAVAEDADLAVELHVRDALLARDALLGRIRRRGRASRRCPGGGRARCRRP